MKVVTFGEIMLRLAAPERFHDCAGPHEHGDIVTAILDGKAERAS